MQLRFNFGCWIIRGGEACGRVRYEGERYAWFGPVVNVTSYIPPSPEVQANRSCIAERPEGRRYSRCRRSRDCLGEPVSVRWEGLYLWT